MSSSAKGCAGPSNLGLGRAFRACSARRRSSLVVIFRLMGEPGTTVTAWPIRSTSWASSVAGKAPPPGVGVQEQLAAKDLRRLGLPEAVAGNGLLRSSVAAPPASTCWRPGWRGSRPRSFRRPGRPRRSRRRPGRAGRRRGRRRNRPRASRGPRRRPPNRTAPGPPCDHVDAENGHVGAELEVEVLAVLRPRSRPAPARRRCGCRKRSAEWSQTARPASGANGFL